METATFGGGCFWCTEAVFTEVKGVSRVVSGYMGGESKNPTYQQICTGKTGHVEVVQLTFDPAVVSFHDLLGAFFATHDPTTQDRQGADAGTQYRSIVYTHSAEQEAEAKAFIRDLDAQQVFKAPIVTRVESAPIFWPAEGYHQDYFANNPNQPYCVAVVAPKVAKFRQIAMAKLKV